MGDIRSSIANVSIHLSHDTNMFVAVEQRILFLSQHTITARSSMGSLVSLEAGIGEHNNQPFGVFVSGWYWCVLFSHQLRESRWG
jgi:hypothetical protein